MAIRKFNAVAGISVGDDVIFEVIDNTANITANNLFVNSVTNLGSISNVKIQGGSNGFVIQTDGQGNLSWLSAGVVGVAGTNTQIQFNNAGSFGSDANFTYNSATDTLNVKNITLENTGNIIGGNLISANFITGNGYLLSNINGANVSGIVANANYSAFAGSSLTAGTVTTNAQPNITSVGTLSNLTVSGNIAVGNISGGNLVSANFFSGDGHLLTNLTIAAGTTLINGSSNIVVNESGNITFSAAPVANVVVVSYLGVNVAGYLTTTGNITGANANLGNLVTANHFSGNAQFLFNIPAANVTGTVGFANSSLFANQSNTAITVTNSSQPNITSLGTLSSLNVSGDTSITGNLTVNGSLANLSVTNFRVQDNLIELSAETLGTPANNAGIRVIRGDELSNDLRWNETKKTWEYSVNGVNFLDIVGTSSTGNTNLGTNAFATTFFGNLTGTATSSNTANTVINNAQPNITSLGTLTSLNINGLANLGTLSNIKINGGLPGYTVVTDGSGNLSWSPGVGSGGGFTNITKDTFNGTGSRTSFQLNATPNNPAAVQVNINGLIQLETSYNVVGSNVIFASPPLNGQKIEIITYGVTQIEASNGQVPFIVDTDLGGSNSFTFNSSTNTLSVTNVTSSGNVSAGNIRTNNLLYANGDPYQFTTNAAGTNTQVQFNDGNLFGASANFTFNKSTNTLSVTNIIANGNQLTNLNASNVVGTVGSSEQSNVANTANSVSGANVSGQVGNALVAGTVYTNAQPNITSVGTLNNLDVSGNAVIGGNLTVSGNLKYVNVETLAIKDPIIELGGGPNGTPLTSDDGKDRGTLLHYYTTQPVDAFIGWDHSNSEFTVASNVSVTNEIVTINQFGNLRANYFIGNGSLLSSVTAGNIVGQVANALVAGTVYTNAQPNITSVGTLTDLSVSGNVTTGNLRTNSLQYANGDPYVFTTNAAGTNTQVQFNNNNVFAGSANFTFNNTTNTLSVTNIIANGNQLTNLNASNVIGTVGSSEQANIANTANSVSGSNVSGQVSNALIAGTVYTNAQPNITSLGTLTDLSVTGNTTTGNLRTDNLQYANGSPYVFTSNAAGANTQIQFNDGNLFAGSANLTFDKTTNTLSVTNIIANGSQLTNINASNISGQVANALVAGTVYTNAQPNITSVGTLTGLVSNGNVQFNNATLVNLGSVSNLKIQGGTSGYVLTTDGAGNLSWTEGTNAGTTVVDSFTADGITDTFTLSVTPTNIDVTTVNYDGVILLKSDYTLTGNQITLSDIPANNAKIEVTIVTPGTGGGGGGGGVTGNIVLDSFVGNGVQTEFILTATPTSENYTIINIDGVLQLRTSYSLFSNVVTFTAPPADGSVIEVMAFNMGSGGGSSGNPGLTWNVVNSNTTAAIFNGYFVDTSTSPVSITLPSSPILGDTIRINDLAGTATTNNITILRNGNKIQGSEDDLVIDYSNTTVELIYSNATYGWKAMEL
jgi:hypothetical protein